MSDLNVELYGPPGSGKTVLLAALYKHLDRSNVTDLQASAKILEQFRQLEARRVLTPTGVQDTTEAGKGAGESLAFAHNGTKVRIVSHAGEMLLKDGALDTKQIVELFKGKPGNIFVAVVNPFVSDDRLAWKALRNLIATLQKRLGANFEEALYIAVDALFHINRQRLDAMSNSLPTLIREHRTDVVVTYDHAVPILEDRFTWQATNQRIADRLKDELRRVVTNIVTNTQPYRDAVVSVTAALDNCMVVLTHIDLTDLTPAIDAADFEPLFDELFRNRADRRVSQQLLAHMFRVNVDTNGITPWEILEHSPRRFYRYIVSLTRVATTPTTKELALAELKKALRLPRIVGVTSLAILLLGALLVPVLWLGFALLGATVIALFTARNG